ncbi:MAG TPA: SxtJ family membrane protein [Ignavibacteriaceae bacterium]|nr:SxtJ family membrane protein [Ignavibacteriaceae bacterium]
MLKEEFNNIKETDKDLRKFGFTIGIFLIIVAGIIYLWKGNLNYYLLLIAFLLIIPALLFPMILKPLNRVWMGLGIVLGWFTSRIILTLLFFLVITPIAFIVKILGKDFLNLKYEKNSSSYWIKKEVKENSKIEYERQF